MVKTTVYLPADLKARIRNLARAQGRPEAEVIRAAIDEYTAPHEPPRPRFPLFEGPEITNIADNVDDILAEGFGRD